MKYITKSIDQLVGLYDLAHEKAPILTNYLSSAIGTIGGDVIAKQFTNNPDIKLRDIIFTATAAGAYSYLAPKMIAWSTSIIDKVKTKWKALENKTTHHIANTINLTLMYIPINEAYWTFLSVKNHVDITLDHLLMGLGTILIGTIPYLVADYIAISKFTSPSTEKYLRPFYSAVELLWNTLFAGANYFAKKF